MNQPYCEKEKEIIEALRAGTMDAGLAKHASACAICCDTVAVSEFLQENGEPAPVLPDSDFLWWRAHLTSKQMAVERATRSITLVRNVSYLGCAAAGLWLVLAPAHLEPIMAALLRHQGWLTDGLGKGAVFAGLGALLLTLLSSLYFARPEE